MKTVIATVLFAAAAPLAAQTAPAPAAAPEAAAPAPAAKFSTQTPIQELAADPAAKVVLEKDLPGLTARPEYEMFKGMSLRQLQAYSDGKLTDELLAKVDTDLAAIK
ncbi:hypothetical protein LZK98_14210 [Sphingomonas cannabina]|uniref:hypothetical protein n=1 Tax=Sphingomonas cannabina TaxID=2899123 RepID=UPI001F2228D3|nr:hypothetical protein [Sphingomonas cannabina]UIJ44223.1 hypothetical protein LZK98_14210 [Sphingomonas cannabina]